MNLPHRLSDYILLSVDELFRYDCKLSVCLLYNYIICFYLLHNAENTFFKDRYTSIIYFQKHRHSENLFRQKLTKPLSLNGKTH